ncbi:Ig-like domain-containing protein [Hungatella sp. L12]|uniref:Ig-like domain-containing protein n=3 Tax=Lachnospiraceae TaxID=186803 RepID=A0ABR7HGD6_9FIRM|nr:Ig-like domain-containing protein [Hungatella hominis]MBC5712197.1 Ig-like domain-containing protein [Hungatella hominis]
MKKKMKKGQAVLSAWTLIAAMGLTPVLSVSYPNGIATVYAKEAVNEAVEEAGTAPMASPSEARREKEKDSAEGEMAQAGITQTDQKADQDAGTSDLEDKTEAKAEEEENEAGTEEIKTKEPEAGAAEVITDKDELIPATPSNATPSNAMFYKGALNIWGGMEMSDHFDGEGTEEEPYEINSDKDLKLLAYHVANEEVDGYEGYYFALTRDISLSDTASWLPIGYFTEAGDSEPKPFKGNFNGQGYRVYNLKISDTTQDYAGLFGSVHGAVIENLTVDGQVNAHSKAALLVGETNDSTISNCSSRGQVRGVGVIGGIVGEAYDSVILECTNTAGVLGGTDADGVNDAYAGGICGSAQSSFMSDCTSDTTDSYSALYSEGYVGGIAGNIYETEIYNTYVEGKVGSTSADYIGGLVGRMQSGQLKNGRFAGTIGASTSTTLKTAGLFVGYIEGGTIDLGDDLAYLYTDSEDKYSLNPFGNKLTPQIRLEHHIGAYYSNQRDFSLYQMGSFIKQTNRYFYEELETGVLEIGKENIHHYAPSKTGDPVRGYLITIPAVDHGTLSVLESQNNFAKEINWANPGAVAKGAKVLVYTSPLNETESEPPVYYELVPDSLSWTTDDFDKEEIIHTNGAETSFTMPEGNITLSAKYRAMTNGVILDKTELTFEIEQIRSGSRWNPQIGWKVTDPQKLTATVIPDTAANKNIIWNVKDTDGSSTDVIHVTENGEVSVNQSAKWIQELIQAGVANQELYPSKKITTEGTNYASVTVTTEAGQKRSSAFVTVNFKITDDTVVPVSDVKLDQSELAFEIVRTLEGDRLDPTERYSVTPSKRLYETITPEYADNKNVKWSVGDADMLRIDSEGIVSAKENAKWILDLIRAEEERNKEHPYAKKEASGTRSNYVTVTTEDGGKQSVCAVNLSFRTDDQTIAHVASVALDKSELKFSIEKVMTGSRANPSVSYQVTDAQQLTAFVMPEEAENKEVSWNSVNEAVVSVSGNGLVTVLPEAAWIKALEKVDADNLARDKYYVSTAAGTMETSIQVLTLDGQKSAECKVIVAFKTTDQTQRPSSGSSGGSSSGGGGGGSSRSVIGSAMSPNSDSAGTWIQDSTGWWYQNKDGSYPAACWQLLTYNGTSEWYHFDEKGYMQTGWFTDTDGNRYYLHAVSDGTRGRMYTGWNLIDGVWYYFNPTSDGTKGSLFMNRQTPDGYRVDASGAWVE